MNFKKMPGGLSGYSFLLLCIFYFIMRIVDSSQNVLSFNCGMLNADDNRCVSWDALFPYNLRNEYLFFVRDQTRRERKENENEIVLKSSIMINNYKVLK